MAHVEVSDRGGIWLAHLDDPTVAEKLESIPAGQSVRLRIAGIAGNWLKMKSHRKTGAPTPGLKAADTATRERWNALYRAHRGRSVDVEIEPEPADTWKDGSDVQRDAAWEAFKALMRAGWRSADAKPTRDELHER
jgi:hypothetical protein